MAALTTAGFFLLFQKLPEQIRKFIVKHSLVTDFLAMVATYYMFGGTITALIAGAIVDIMVSAMLHIANHPSDFQWLFDMLDQVKLYAVKIQDSLREYNLAWRAKQVAPAI